MADEKRLIDANALKEKAEPEEVTGEGIVYVQDIDEAPTVDAVEVVRCKDCTKRTYSMFDGCAVCHPCGYKCIDPEWYCPEGERKDND